MIGTLLQIAMFTVLTSGLAVAVWSVAGPSVEVAAELSVEPPSLSEAQRSGPPAARTDSIVGAAVARAAFRADRTPPVVSYTLQPASDALPAASKPDQRPALTLSGIVWGPRPAAVLDGLPRIEGSRVVGVGESVAGLTIRRIDRDGAVVAGYDTTWRLTIRVPWP
jgi:hypothetical protein